MSAMLIIAAALVALSGLFSGLNLGLMSFADEDLRIVIEGSPDENKVRNAQRIRPLRARGNLLLCTLLLGNTLVNAMIAILLGDMAGGIVGGIVTTGLIVVFGEIIPQSVCSRYALAIGARSVPIVWVFLVVCLPIAYPISLVLDWALGREVSATYTNCSATLASAPRSTMSLTECGRLSTPKWPCAASTSVESCGTKYEGISSSRPSASPFSDATSLVKPPISPHAPRRAFCFFQW